MSSEKAIQSISNAIHGTLSSPNEVDRNMEIANVVDGLFAIARGLKQVANAIDRMSYGDGLQNIDGSRTLVELDASPLNRIVGALYNLAESQRREARKEA